MTRQAYDLNTQGFGPGTNGPLVIRRAAPRPVREAPDRRVRGPPSPRARDYVRRRSRINRTGDAALITAIPTTSPQDKKTENLVNHIRDDVSPTALKGSGIDAKVGGVTAALEDQSEYMKGRMPLFIGSVLFLSFLLLLVAFHSPLISLKAGIMNLLSVSAAYGV